MPRWKPSRAAGLDADAGVGMKKLPRLEIKTGKGGGQPHSPPPRAFSPALAHQARDRGSLRVSQLPSQKLNKPDPEQLSCSPKKNPK